MAPPGLIAVSVDDTSIQSRNSQRQVPARGTVPTVSFFFLHFFLLIIIHLHTSMKYPRLGLYKSSLNFYSPWWIGVVQNYLILRCVVWDTVSTFPTVYQNRKKVKITLIKVTISRELRWVLLYINQKFFLRVGGSPSQKLNFIEGTLHNLQTTYCSEYVNHSNEYCLDDS